jgi:hypothetical protein
MLRRVALVRTDVSEDRIFPIIRVKLVYVVTELKETGDGVMVPVSKEDDGGTKFLRNVGFYNSYKA